MTKKLPTRGRPREADDAQALAAAARLFRRRGYAATTVREIAREARMLPGSLHYRFPSKERLLLALMERGLEAATSAVRGAIAGVDDPIERLRLGITAHLELLVTGGDAVHVLLDEWRALKGPALAKMVRLRDRYEAFWDGLLQDALATGMGREGIDPHLARLLGFGAINSVARWYRPGGPHSAKGIADAFFADFAFGLLADDARPRDAQAAFAALTAPSRGKRCSSAR